MIFRHLHPLVNQRVHSPQTFFMDRNPMRHPYLVLILLLSALTWGCTDGNENNLTPLPDDSSADTKEDADTSEDETAACAPITVTPAQAAAVPGQLAYFEASGGAGNLEFKFQTNASGGIVNRLTGAYLAGQAPGVTDVITVSDAQCTQSAQINVDVFETMTVKPQAIEIAPDNTFTFEVAQGSGQYTFELQTNASGGAITPQGAYTSGPNEGLDAVVLTDTATGQRIDIAVTVSSQARFGAAPAQVSLPVGQSYKLAFRGGSGEVTSSGGDGLVTVDEQGVVTAIAAGEVNLTLQDRFTKEETQVTIHVVQARAFDQNIGGNYGGINSRVISNVDINGDGHLDAVLTYPDIDTTVGGYRSGALFVYEGSPTGLKPEPVRVLRGGARNEEFGSDAVIADVTGDDLPDLIVSAHRADYGAAAGGVVFVYEGKAGQWFDQAPLYQWSGDSASDSLGYALTVCDFNGDDRLDIAVGALTAEDNGANPVRGTQGMIQVYLNYDSGFLPRADIELYGKQPNGDGAWVNTANMRLGESLASGDVDGDGVCDLVSGTQFVSSPAGGNSSGGVFVYRGREADDLGPGGPALDPSWAVRWDSATSRGARMGRRVAVGDLNGDGKAEVAAGMYNYRPNDPLTQAGAVAIYSDLTLDSGAAVWTPHAETYKVLVGTNRSDLLGWEVLIDDANGDGVQDVLAGAINGEASGGPGNTGSVGIYYGSPEGLQDAPDVLLTASTTSSRFGQGFALAGDLDGDSINDYLGFAQLADTAGRDVGDLFAFYSNDLNVAVPLEIEYISSGNRTGSDVSFVPDFNGDGRHELVVGAGHYIDTQANHAQGGAVFVYPSTPTGWEVQPAQILSGFYTNSALDRFGERVRSAGDFNGDGIADLVAIATHEDKPSNHNAAGYAQSNTCAGAASADSGAAYIFLGKADGLFEQEPAFIIRGNQTSDVMREIAAGVDVNGDGKDDIVYGSYLWDTNYEGDALTNAGGWAVVYGRAVTEPGKLFPICTPDMEAMGDRTSAFVGWSMAEIGDLDGDGCDEFVVGAREHSAGTTRQGQVRVVFGWGTGCNSATPKQVALAPGLANARAGEAVDGGHDLDGDGLPDLLVGGLSYRVGPDTVGAAWLLSGADIAMLAQEDVVSGKPADIIHPFNLGTGTKVIEGTEANGGFGRCVAMIPALDAALIGAPTSGLNGSPLSGGASVHVFDSGSFQLDAIAHFAGETQRASSSLGERCDAASSAGGSYVAISGTTSSAVGIDQGAAYVSQIK